jgi:acyl-CoA thioester hydrolase
MPEATNILAYRTTNRVIYGDTDRMGYAYNANYLRWFEIGRAELFRHLGLTYRQIEERGIYLPVSEAYCKYISPVRYDDLIVIEAALDHSVKGGVKFDYRIFGEDGTSPVAEGFTKHPCVSREGRVLRPPQFLRDFIQQKLSEQQRHL